MVGDVVVGCCIEFYVIINGFVLYVFDDKFGVFVYGVDDIGKFYKEVFVGV